MKCPVCTSTDLVMAERQGVEIDYCPACRGVWLDRGELDKIIERSGVHGSGHASPGYEPERHPQQPVHPLDHGRSGHHGHTPQGYGHGHHDKKKKSFLSEIFDFG